MARSESKILPKFESLDKLVEFFDIRDMGDYWDRMPDAAFEINVKRRKYLIAIDEALVPRLSEIAKSKKISSERLINTWVKEKLRRAAVRRET